MVPFNVVLWLFLAVTPALAEIPVSFDHGVASGDPLPTAVIIWTRTTVRSALTPPTDTQVRGTWTVSLTPDMKHKVTEGTFETNGDLDWTVKVDATGLEPGNTYYYQFESGGILSPMGKTKTPPNPGDSLDRVRYAIFGCSAWGFSYFHAYDFASRYDDLDFVIHLGDFMYEYNRGQLAPKVYGRQGFRHIPYTEPLPSSDQVTGHFDTPTMAGELLTFEDYIARYKSYRSDPGLQAVSAAAPWLAIWDDHESADNSYVEGSRNHNDTSINEGEWTDRKAAAIRAWHLYMPIRTEELTTPAHIYRQFQFGDLISLILLENRLVARTNSNPTSETPFEIYSDEIDSIYQKVLDIIGDTPIDEWDDDDGTGNSVEQQLLDYKAELDEFRRRPDGAILGSEQEEFLRTQIDGAVAAGTRWVVLGQQQVMGDTILADYEGAVENAPTAVQKAFWNEVLYNLTEAESATTCNYATYPAHHRNEYMQCLNVTDDIRDNFRVLIAAGRYQINWEFDDWKGYLEERARVLETLSAMNGNVIVHASDLHNEFANVLRTDNIDSTAEKTENGLGRIVGAEFTIATTSGGLESKLKHAPMDFNDAAIVSGNQHSMRYASTNGKGTAIMTVTHNKAHVDYYFFDQPSQLYYQGVCDVGLDYYHSSFLDSVDLSPEDNDLVFGQCLPGPGGMPYEWMMRNTGIYMSNPHLRDVAF